MITNHSLALTIYVMDVVHQPQPRGYKLLEFYVGWLGSISFQGSAILTKRHPPMYYINWAFPIPCKPLYTDCTILVILKTVAHASKIICNIKTDDTII